MVSQNIIWGTFRVIEYNPKTRRDIEQLIGGKLLDTNPDAVKWLIDRAKKIEPNIFDEIDDILGINIMDYF